MTHLQRLLLPIGALSFIFLIGWESVLTAQAESTQDSMALYLQGKELVRSWSGDSRKLDEAEGLFKEALRQDGRFAPGYAGLADVTLQRGYINYDNFEPLAIRKALEMVERALAIDPSCVQALSTRGFIRILQGDTAGAREDLEQAVALDPNWAGAHALLGDLSLKGADSATAIESYRRAIELAQSNQPHLVNDLHGSLAALYRSLKRYEEAESEYHVVLAIRPDSPWAWVNYCAFLQEKGDLDGAIAACEKALSLADFGMGRYRLAQAYYFKGRRLFWELNQEETARPWFERSIEMQPLPNTLYSLGMYWMHRTQGAATKEEFNTAKKRAIELFETVLRIKSDHEQAGSALETARSLQQ